MSEPTPYDIVPYTSYAYPRSHPDRLHVVASMFGMSPAPVAGCRVLELGCASGGNLIPMAFHLPESEFVGVDLAAKQVEPGRKAIEELGLDNIRLERGSILEVDDSWGTFDYVLCHGVYSWVSAEVRDEILSICASQLRPQGVAYVSYNTYPGWHLREMVRHMMCYHVAQFDEPEQRVAQARALIDFLARYASNETPQGLLLKEEVDLMGRVSDDYLYHDMLEDENVPLYFHQFAEHAQAHDLQYLGEAEFHTMLARGLPDDVAETLDRIAQNITAFEQYMDFVRNRAFRCTLLCHSDVSLDRDVRPDSLSNLLIASPLEQVEAGRPAPGEVTFSTPGGRATTADPVTKAALHVLGRRWPEPMPFSSLVDDARALVLGSGKTFDDANGATDLARELLYCHARNLIELRSWTPPITRRAGALPRVSRLARYQAGSVEAVTNLRHESTTIDAVTRHLLPMLDGKTGRRELIERMTELATEGILEVEEGGERITESERVRGLLDAIVEDALERLGQAALLEA